MCIIAKIRAAQAVLVEVGKESELVKRVSAEYNNQNFAMALDMVNILLNAAAAAVLTPEFLYSELNAGQCKIEYTKADGSTRKALATLSEKHGAPKHDRTKRDPKRAHLLSYYDLDKKAWRSCKLEAITEFTRVLGGK